MKSCVETYGTSKKEIDSMAEFIALFYAKGFLTSSLTVCSPCKDLEAIWEMKEYMAFNPTIAKKCLASMMNHTCMFGILFF